MKTIIKLLVIPSIAFFLLSSCEKPQLQGSWDWGAGSYVDILSRIFIINNTFSPNNFTIKKGITVIWNNNDSYSHNLVSSSNPSLKGIITSNGEIKYTPQIIGTINYKCTTHSETGTLTVTP